ncbi:MAG: hypothetical protein AAF798_19640 [Bacteroidota bacterium]
MPQFQTVEVPTWVESRVLQFLNNARAIEDIIESSALLDDPNSGGTSNITIGATVAQRIIDRRLSLSRRRFSSVRQLEGIAGFGTDKFNDLVYSFGKPAAEAFRAAMFNGVIMDNWVLSDYTQHFEDEIAFRALVGNESAFKEWVSYRMKRAWEEQGLGAPLAEAKRQLLYQSYLEIFDVEHYGAIELAFYFYQFDADNWFSFDRVRTVCEQYLSYFPDWRNRQELRMFKGFNKVGIQSTSTQQGSLPVVVNYGEQAITIWQAELFD